VNFKGVAPKRICRGGRPSSKMKIIAGQKFKLKTREFIPYTTETDDALMVTIIMLYLWQKRRKSDVTESEFLFIFYS
jgi:hypothetical protein